MQKYIEITKALMPEIISNKTFHATFILKKNRIQKIGLNSFKTHPANLRYNYFGKEGKDIRTMVGIHSELSAILKYGKEDCSDCVFLNVRIDKNGTPTMAKPCRGCQDLLIQVGFKKVYYTNFKGEFEEWIPSKEEENI
jgi:deoxycytidylate deaminase